MSIEAFDFAEKFQTPVFVMTDLDLGMNNWMADPFAYPEKPIHRGKVLTAEDLDKLGGFARYKDVDGDGVGYRTLPGTNHPTRVLLHARQRPQREGPVHRARRRLHQQHGPPGAQVRGHAQARSRAGGAATPKARRSASWPSAPRITRCAKAAISCSDEYDIDASYLRLKAYPFTEQLLDFIRRHDRVYVVDQNRDAQLLGLMRLEFDAGPDRQTAQRALLRRPAARCAHRHRRNRQTGGQMSTTVTPPPKKVNRIGLEVLNYKGSKTTLCAGCGHNSISERIIECFYDLGVEPYTVAKFSGIGCSSKSPAYFLGLSHGFNACTAACRPSPPAPCWPTAPCWVWASPATATPHPSASASSCTWCAATCR